MESIVVETADCRVASAGGAALTEAVVKLLAECTEAVLAQMFFVRPLGEPAPAGSGGPSDVVVDVNFAGETCGTFTLSVTAAAARLIAADFLAEEESVLSEQQVQEVICELTSIICGSVLMRVESQTPFHLAAPKIVWAGRYLEGEDGLVHRLHLWNGNLTVAFRTEGPGCSVAEESVY
jgi:CheY-specific phosphatase CheX